MNYKVLYSKRALKDLKKLDRGVQRLILDYMKDLENLAEPRFRGKALSGDLKGLWRYRIGQYRIICRIEDDKIIISVITLGHRRNIYKNI